MHAKHKKDHLGLLTATPCMLCSRGIVTSDVAMRCRMISKTVHLLLLHLASDRHTVHVDRSFNLSPLIATPCIQSKQKSSEAFLLAHRACKADDGPKSVAFRNEFVVL